MVPDFFGDASYCQYLLQFIVYSVWPMAKLSWGDLIALLAALFFLSTLTVFVLLRPAKRQWMTHRQQPARTMLLPCAVFVVLVVVGVSWEHVDIEHSGNSPYKAYVHVADGALDIRLNWTSEASGRAIINPSLLITKNGTLVRAAREHALVHSTVDNARWNPRDTIAYKDPATGETRQVQAGKDLTVTEEVQVWESALVVAESPIDAASRSLTQFAKELDGGGRSRSLQEINVTSNLRTKAAWGGASAPLCQRKPFYNPENNTLSRTDVRGAEDPKLFLNPDGSGYGAWSLAFSSLPPEEHRPGCQEQAEAVKQMYVSVTASRQSASEPAAAVRVDCGFTARDEKNWIAFWRGNQLHFVYSLYPHRVLLVRPADGACLSKWSTSSFGPMQLLAQSAAGLRLHGSATAVRYGTGYLALIHVLDASRRYSTMAYTFQGHPPFAATAISKPLPLTASNQAFASGLLLVPRTDRPQHDTTAEKAIVEMEAPNLVVVTYGVADAEPRALVMSHDFFATLFDVHVCHEKRG